MPGITPNITLLGAFRDGGRRLWNARAMVCGLVVFVVAIAVPLHAAIGTSLSGFVPAGRLSSDMFSGAGLDWWGAPPWRTPLFLPATGYATALETSTVRYLDARALVALLGVHLLLSTFAAGGTLDRLARNRAVGAVAFLAACWVWCFRFVRLAVLSAPLYLGLFLIAPPAGLYRLGLYDANSPNLPTRAQLTLAFILFGLVLSGINALFDYARVRAVVEDRRSMVGALVAAWRFIKRHPGAALGLYLLDTLLFLAGVLLHRWLAPVAGALGPWPLVVVCLGLATVVRLQFVASQVALFQGRLARPGYVAAPVRSWSESPAVNMPAL